MLDVVLSRCAGQIGKVLVQVSEEGRWAVAAKILGCAGQHFLECLPKHSGCFFLEVGFFLAMKILKYCR